MIYHVYDVILIPIVKTYIIVVKALIEQVWPHRCSGCDVKYSGWDARHSHFVFMKQYEWYYIYWIWCHKYTGCDVIPICCDVIKCSCDVMHTECDVIHRVCNVIERVGVTQLTHWYWWYGYSGCSVRYRGLDGKYNFCVVIHVMLYIVCVMSWMQWM